jgi:hypothetical protein
MVAKVHAGILAATFAVLTGGCASPATGPSYLSVPRAQYEQAFLAACEVARSEGLVPEIADRQTGTISTEPRPAGSALEPWTWRELTASDVVAGTFGYERRRASFEFVPAGFKPLPGAGSADSSAPLAGPVLPGSERRVGTGLGADGSPSATGDLELRVSVSVERQFRPGYQGTAYTRALGSFCRDVTVEEEDPAPARDRSIWTPVARDERLERALIARIAERLAAQ